MPVGSSLPTPLPSAGPPRLSDATGCDLRLGFTPFVCAAAAAATLADPMAGSRAEAAAGHAGTGSVTPLPALDDQSHGAGPDACRSAGLFSCRTDAELLQEVSDHVRLLTRAVGGPRWYQNADQASESAGRQA